MSSARVDSPLLNDFRTSRQPSPPILRVSTMPKPRACRQLFPVDHAETNDFFDRRRADENARQNREFGFDFSIYRPLTDQSGSRYTDWEAVPASSVPSVYRESAAQPRKSTNKKIRPHALYQNSETFNSILPSPAPSGFATTTTGTSPRPGRTAVVLETETARSFVPVHRRQLKNKKSTKTATISTPKPCPKESEPTRLGGLGPPQDNTPGKSASRSSESLSRITDYMRQRKRHGSGNSASSEESTGDKHQIPGKRPRSTSSHTASPTDITTKGLS